MTKDLLAAIAAGFCIGVAFALAWKADPTEPPKPVPITEIYMHDAHGVLRPMPETTPLP